MGRVMLAIVLPALAAAMIGYLLLKTVFAPPLESLVWRSWSDHVVAGGEFKAVAIGHLGPENCFVRAERRSVYSNGSQAVMMGDRQLQPDGSIRFSATVRPDAPKGPATFLVRDLFNCGPYAHFATSPSVPFEVE